MTLKDGLICLLDGRTGNNNDTIWKDLSGNENDFVLQNWTFNNDNKWTGYSIKKSKDGGVIQFKDGILSNVRSIIMKVKIQDFSEPSYLIDLRPGAGWIYSAGMSSDFVRTLKYTEDGLGELGNNFDNINMVSDKFVCYYLELDNNKDCHVFLGSRFSLDEKFSGEIKNVYIYNRPLSDEEIMKLCKDVSLLKKYVNNNNLPTIVNKLMDASNIKIANNKYGNRVQTVIDKIVEKADNVTKAINQEVINTDYSFKVGTGTNVDVSSDVQDGFSAISIKGNTYQNLINTNSNISFAGNSRHEDIINDNNKSEVKALSDGSMVLCKDGMFKDNTTYTVVANVFVSRSTQVGFSFKSDNNFTQGLKYLSPIKVGDYATYIVPITTTTNCTSVVVGNHGAFLTNDVLGIDKLMVFEGDYSNNPNLPAYFEGIIGVGDKSKNLFNFKLHDTLISKNDYIVLNKDHGNSKPVFYNVKPKTDYIIRITKAFKNQSLWVGLDVDDVYYNNGNDEVNIKSITTNSTGLLKLRVGANTYNDIGQCCRIELIEKSDFFDGMPYQDCYEGYKIEFLSHNKNLVIEQPKTLKTDVVSSKVYLKPNTTYSISSNLDYYDGLVILNYKEDNQNAKCKFQDWGQKINKFTTPSDISSGYYYIVFWKSGLKANNDSWLQIEKNDKITEFIPREENKTQILLDEPLMKLSNGVCDEITKDGKLIRRVGKIVEDGSGEWTHYTTAPASSENMLFGCERGLSVATNSMESLLCNNFSVSNSWNDSTREGVRIGRSGLSGLDIRINKSKLKTPDVSGFKQWLSNNPTTVYYELAEPVITDIVPPSVRIYKDGHLTFNTLVAPESTHLVQLNKSAQINNTLEQVQSLNKKVDALDIIYNSLISSTSNTLSNLNK